MARGSVLERVPSLGFWLIFLLFIANFGVDRFPAVEAIWLTLPTSGTKCVSEEIHSNVVVMADYYVIDENEPGKHVVVHSRITSPLGNTIKHFENATYGQFAFTTQESGTYLACFWVDSSIKLTNPLTLGLDWKIGIAAKDWDSVAKKEKLKGVELQLKRLEAIVEAIHQNINDLMIREVDMRVLSEKTNSRVARFSIMSLGICFLASIWQTWHLKRYFQKKKLI